MTIAIFPMKTSQAHLINKNNIIYFDLIHQNIKPTKGQIGTINSV